MKNLLQNLFFFLLTTQICFGQWYAQNSGTTQHLNKVQFVDANTGWAVGDSGMILYTTNAGVDWVQQASGTNLNLVDISFVDANKGWVVGENFILKTTNGSISWSQQIHDSLSLNALCFIDENIGWLVGNEILKTTDGGNNWISQSHQISEPLQSAHFLDAMTGWVASPLDIEKTTDGGGSWTEPMHFHFRSEMYSIYFINADTGWAAGVDDPFIREIESVYKTTDGGTVWSLQHLGMGFSTLFDIHFSDAFTGCAVGSSGVVYKTIDGGDNWSNQTTWNSGLHSVYFIDSNTGWAVGANGTILHTTNGGVPVEFTSFTATSNGEEVILSWTTATETNNSGFEILRFTQNDNDWNTIGFVPGFGTTTEPKSYRYTDTKLSAGKYTYRLKQIDFDGSFEYSQEVEVEVSAPLTFNLEQNYPNPFNSSTVINYQLPVSSDVTFKLFDILGNEIATLVNEYKPAGRYEVEFNAVSLPSGVYLYQLQAGEYTAVKKMLLLK